MIGCRGLATVVAAALPAAVLIAAGGCGMPESTTRAPRPSVKPGEFGVAGCFFARQAQDFQVLDDRNLIVFAPSKSNPYHITISPPSPELRWANGLAFESRNTQVCGYAGDHVLLADGPGPRRYSVIAVHRLDEDALHGLQARFGVGSAPQQAEPEPAEGAEIEKELGGDQPAP